MIINRKLQFIIIVTGLFLTPIHTLAQERTATKEANSGCTSAATVIGGGVGLLLGGYVGYKIDRELIGSGGEDPGMIGLVVGAVLGAAGGVLLARDACGEGDRRIRNEVRSQLHEPTYSDTNATRPPSPVFRTEQNKRLRLEFKQ